MEDNSSFKLDLIDKKILFELDKNCRIPATRLAKMVHKSRQAVEYRINNLVEKGVITGFKASINPHKIGRKLYKIYLKLRNIEEKKKELFNFLRKSDNVYWIGESSGRWDLIFGIFAEDDHEFFEIKNNFISNFRELIIEEYGDILVDVNQYPKMYFTNEVSSPIMFGGKVVNNKLDKIDLKILSIVAKNARESVVEISTKVKTTPAIVIGRLKKLEKLGVIIQYRIEVDISKLNLENYKAIIKIDKYGKDDEKRLFNYLSNKYEMQYLIRNLWQIELELVVKNFQDYYDFIEKLKADFPNVIRTVDTVQMIKDEWTTGFENLFR